MTREPPLASDPGRRDLSRDVRDRFDDPDAGPAGRPAGGAQPPGSPAGEQSRGGQPGARPVDERAVAPPAGGVGEPGGGLPQHQIRRTRTGGLWVAVTAAAVVLLLFLIFILQNGRQVQVSFLGAEGHLPLGVAMLLSGVAGALLIALLGAARIVQLRLVARRHRGADAAARRWTRRARSTRDTGPVQRQP